MNARRILGAPTSRENQGSVAREPVCVPFSHTRFRVFSGYSGLFQAVSAGKNSGLSAGNPINPNQAKSNEAASTADMNRG
jgi:hypothetical protein